MLDNDELACLASLENVEVRETLPSGCDIPALLAGDLIEELSGRWVLTGKGKLRLANLRSLARAQASGHG